MYLHEFLEDYTNISKVDIFINIIKVYLLLKF